MNYYPFNVGDYAAHTAHLEPMEDLAYRRLLDAYYLREGPLPADVQVTAKLIRMRSCAADVQAVLAEFFVLTDDGWRHKRCDEEIARMQDKQAKARASAHASVSVRRAKAQQAPEANAERTLEHATANAERTLPKAEADVELPTPTPTPKEVSEEANASSSSAEPTGRQRSPTIPCPYEAIVSAYHAALPELPAVRLMSAKRQAAMRKLWGWVLSSRRSDGQRRAETAEDALAWLKAYFERASANDFLMGRGARSGEHAGWTADFDFLLEERGMKHVLERTQVAA